MSIEPQRHGQTIIFPASLDPDAVSVVKRLVDSGFESYLVGGCVRDLLCGMIPKDFDVSTAARPRQIRSRFRNCRVIGRRFKLAHVHFGEKIIEVATFRRMPDEQGEDDENEDLLIVRDNEYGTAEEDALRRDFTINALLYDVNTDEVIDYVGGVADLDERVLRTIGDAQIRLAEDPVRMLRAVKFSSRLGLTLDDGLDKAMRDCSELIAKSSPPRVLEEIYKLLSCGRAARALPMLAEYGLLAHLLPEFAPWWLEHPETLEALGAALDVLDHGTRRLPNAFLLSALALEPWRATLEAEGADPMAAISDLLTPAARRMSIPRRDVAICKQLLTLQPKLERNKRNRRVKMADFLSRPATHQAVDLLYVSCLVGTADPAMHALWARRLAERLGTDEPPDTTRPVRDTKEGGGKRRRRRRRGGRGRSGREDGDNQAERSQESAGEPAAPRSRRRKPKDTEASPSPPNKPDKSGKSAETAEAASAGAAAASSGRASEAAPSPPPSAPTPAPSTTRGDAGTDPTSPEPPGGLRGLLKRVVQRLRPGADEQQGAASGAATDPAPSSPPAPARTGPRRKADTAAPSGPPAQDAGADTQADPAPGAGKDADATDPTAEEKPSSDERPRRRRRRRSRVRGGRGGRGDPSQGDGDGDRENESDGGDEQQQASRDDAPSEGARRPRRRRGGSRRSRSRSRSGQDSGAKGSGDDTSAADGQDAPAPKPTGKGKSPSSSTSRPKRTRSGRGRGSSGKDGDSEVASSPKEPPPVHQRPEDIEDYFDW